MLASAFLAITVVAIGLFYLATGKNKKVLAFYVAWLALIGGTSYSGFLQDTDAMPPRILLVLLPSLLAMVLLYKALPSHTANPKYLLGIHALRLPIEVVLHQLYLQGKIPKLMTYSGWNFDILMGISALGLLLYVWLGNKQISPTVFKFWNLAGLAFLLWIVGLAVLAAPLPIQQLAFEQPNIAILEFPFTYLPAIVVPIVFMAHLHGVAHSKPRPQ